MDFQRKIKHIFSSEKYKAHKYFCAVYSGR